MTSTASDVCSPAAFERRYREAADPWNFASSKYELARYDALLGSLSRAIFPNAFEPGCSIGVLTEQLAKRCHTVLATDVSATALELARVRCKRHANVHFKLSDIATQMPENSFDLIVFSEIGYYFQPETLATIAQQLASRLEPDGELMAVHWLGRSADHVLHGDRVHAVLGDALPLRRRLLQRHSGFRLESWTKV